MARGKPRTQTAARSPADDPIATRISPAPNGNGPAKVYRHKGEKRRNIPPAAIAAEGKVPAAPKLHYSYSPRLDPVRFDPNGAPDKLPELLDKAKREPLTDAEARLLAEALRGQDPWLEWAGKRESNGFAVDPVALHMHERVSTQAILKVAARKDVTRDLFADPQLDYHQAVQFYRHDMDWSNRLILGDSLQVMASLAQREDLAGKVQMIYVDPPYGIKFASNFQPQLGQRNVRDREQDLTREPEMVKAYRDTWTLGIHSYLTYLRDRLAVSRELLSDTGSIFVQISDENLHRVRCVMDEVFQSENFIAQITFRTTSSLGGDFIPASANYLLWYARERQHTKFRSVFRTRGFEDDVGGRFSRALLANGTKHVLTSEERKDIALLAQNARIYRHDNMTSQSGGENSSFPIEFQGSTFKPGKGFWKTNPTGVERLKSAERVAAPTPNSLTYVRFLNDFPLTGFSEVWNDTQTGAFTDSKVYVVQTNTKVIERCLLMTTDPGDLVLDPTCGSGTTAYVAEQWGRRWITCDSSRVTLVLAKHRLMTAKFDFYQVRPLNADDVARNSKGAWLTDSTSTVPGKATFLCKTIPHITLKSIARNTSLDPIFAKHEPILEKGVAA
jgi:adenine-specific DNA-methyltransferase